MPSLVSPRPVEHIRLDGGRSCLDFVNSIHDRRAAVCEDYLVTQQRYVAWCIRAGLLTATEARRINRNCSDEALMRDIGNFREALYAVFCARIDDRRAPGSALKELDKWLHRAWQGLALDMDAPGRLTWLPHRLDGRLPMRRLALSALELLQDAAPERLKRCSACGWLFYDGTKNNRRQWCSMQTCGTAAKMRRYRSRVA
jgi:predicted RNA-binding Zn ribbon-like protein